MVKYESEIFAQHSKGVLPFRIVVEEKIKDGMHEVWVKRIELQKKGDTVYEEQRLLMSSFYREDE